VNPTRPTFFRNSLALALATAALLVLACSSKPVSEPGGPGAAAAPDGSVPAPKLLDDLGGHSHPIRTSSPLAQRYFDQGLVLTFGFNHEAAVRSFEHATSLDPGCAMCFWGIALALGPNINAPMGPDAGRRAYAAAQEALRLAPNASPKEQAMIEALATRYAAHPEPERTALDRAYAEAMRGVATRYPDDLDIATLFAESLMDLHPWDYWTDAAAPRQDTPEILAQLERVLARQPAHVGANHYYIHAVEEFFPERGVAAADRLAQAAPDDAGHLVHMPSHIYWRVGRYEDALEINQRAIAADEAFFSWCRAGPFYEAAYYPHNVHFLWAAASTEGRSEIALSAARKLAASTSEQVDAYPFVEEFMAIPGLTLARFGRWDAILGEPQPAPERRYLTGIWYYTRGLALARTGAPEVARAELARLRAVAAEPAATELLLAGGTATASALLEIGAAHLDGEIAAAQGLHAEAITALESAVTAQDALVYMEPPPWYLPSRQALGAVLLDAGRADDAEAVYRLDLEKLPRNGWSLYGLSRSLRAQERDSEADWAERGFETAWARADVELRASRF